MEQLLSKLANLEAKVHSLRKACKQNNIGISFLNGFNIKKMKDIYSRLEKHYQQNPEKGKVLWFQSQLKLFNWVLICYSFVTGQKIENFNQSDWSYFKRIFSEKDIYTFKYESKKLLNKDSKNQRIWNTEEDQILTTIMEDSSMRNRWSQVARMFYEISNQKYFRTGKQCREHWLNHLDPSKKHGKWNVQEDLIILKYVILNGKKWSTISKEQLPQRTEHMIKNRFKSLVYKFQKSNDIPLDNQIQSIKSIINDLQNQNHEKSSIEKQIKNEQIEDSMQDQSSLIYQDQVKSQQNPKNQLKLVVSEQKIAKILATKTQLLPQEISLSQAQIQKAQMQSPITPSNLSVFGVFYQPTFLYFPMATYWNVCPSYIENFQQSMR